LVGAYAAIARTRNQLAALLGQLLGDWLGFHAAARLATTVFGALFLAFLAGAARSFHGDAAGRIQDGDPLEIDTDKGVIVNQRSGETIACPPVPPSMPSM